jgi:hypothetical protein
MRPLLLALLVVASPACAAETVQLPGTKHSIRFPVAATCETVTLEVQDTSIPQSNCTAFDEAAGIGYSIEHVDLPATQVEATPQARLLEAAVANAEMWGNAVATHRYLEVGGQPALEATFAPKAKGHFAFARYVLVGNALITVIADGFASAEPTPAATGFLESLVVSAPWSRR